ncbi:MAG: hypothetical protein Q4D98_02970 [Planctomycetia bacterium]|nr:hypothetical protein [Planctomycetia bacterium]
MKNKVTIIINGKKVVDMDTENPNDTSDTNVPHRKGGLPWLRGGFDLPEDFNPYFPKEVLRVFFLGALIIIISGVIGGILVYFLSP